MQTAHEEEVARLKVDHATTAAVVEHSHGNGMQAHAQHATSPILEDASSLFGNGGKASDFSSSGAKGEEPSPTSTSTSFISICCSCSSTTTATMF